MLPHVMGNSYPSAWARTARRGLHRRDIRQEGRGVPIIASCSEGEGGDLTTTAQLLNMLNASRR